MLMYRVAKKPDGPLGMVIYLLMGRAGDGALIGNDWYHYRRGKLVKDEKEALMRKPGYYIEPIRDATPEDIQRLERNIGRRWSLLDNCLRISPRLMP